MSDSTVEVHDGAGVLIVEDEALVALFLEDTLDTLGYRCCGVADNAEEAVSLAQARRPALALVDVGLRGDRDGIALPPVSRDSGSLSLFSPERAISGHGGGPKLGGLIAYWPSRAGGRISRSLWRQAPFLCQQRPTGIGKPTRWTPGPNYTLV